MNFCGLDHRQVLDMESAASKIPESVAAASGFQCGGVCARVDEDDFFGTGDRLPDIALDSSEDPVTDDDVATGKTGSSEKKKLPVTNALDNIQQTLEDNRASDTAVSAVSVASVTTFSSSNRSKTKFPLHSTQQQNTPSSRNQVGSHTPSPSPSLLNPLTTKWKELATVDQPSMPTLLFPIPDIPMSSPTLEALMQRLEGGFRVRLTGGPISCLAGEDSVCLYLHDDRSRLCFVSDSHPKRSGWIDENKDEGYCWIEIPVTDILRLEIGGNNKSSKSFSIVIEKERGCLVYYDFEASSAIDREVIVSTLILLLDNTHNARSDQDDIYDWSGGTMDQPILCSPSLDHPIDFSSHVDQLIVCSPSLEHDPCRTTLQLSPRRRTQIYSNNDNAETETSLVIHLEDFSISDSNASRKCTEWYRRELPSTSLQQKSSASEEAEDIRLDFKPSASSTQLGICANHSTNIGTTAWCAADSCALALNDIADTCTGIFALKQNESTCAPTLGKEQRVVIEKFIASALGAPTAMYSYLTEGDIWNIETSVSNQEPKDTTIRRNRASILNAQAARLRGLRNEMTFAAALKQSKERMHFVQTVQSFDDAYTRVGGTKKLRAANEAANRFHSSPLLKSIVDSMVMHDPDGHSRDEEIAYYDSDPEDSRPLSADKGPRQMAADRLNRTHETKIDGHYVGALNGVGFEDIGTNKKVSRKIDEEAIVEIVQAMNNERLTLMWHPTQRENEPHRSPVCVKVWIEAGVYLNDGTFLLPKLTWTKASQDISFMQQPLEKLDLLDICGIRPVASVNRSRHPFALSQKSFYIETQTDTLVFQSQSPEERDRIVYGLKLVIARLASLLMLRDIRAAEEFFGAITNMVPGEAPTWAQGKEEGSISTAGITENSLVEKEHASMTPVIQ